MLQQIVHGEKYTVHAVLLPFAGEDQLLMSPSVHDYGGAGASPVLTEKAVPLGSYIVNVAIWPLASLHPILSSSLLKIHPCPVAPGQQTLPLAPGGSEVPRNVTPWYYWASDWLRNDP